MIIITYIILNILASIFGVKEAILFQRQGIETFKWNIHRIFVFERAMLIALMISSIFLNIEEAIFIGIAYVLSFSFFHNGAYGYTKLYTLKSNESFFKDIQYSSPNDSAKYRYDFTSRLYMLIASLIILIVVLVVKYT